MHKTKPILILLLAVVCTLGNLCLMAQESLLDADSLAVSEDALLDAALSGDLLGESLSLGEESVGAEDLSSIQPMGDSAVDILPEQGLSELEDEPVAEVSMPVAEVLPGNGLLEPDSLAELEKEPADSEFNLDAPEELSVVDEAPISMPEEPLLDVASPQVPASDNLEDIFPVETPVDMPVETVEVELDSPVEMEAPVEMPVEAEAPVETVEMPVGAVELEAPVEVEAPIETIEMPVEVPKDDNELAIDFDSLIKDTVSDMQAPDQNNGAQPERNGSMGLGSVAISEAVSEGIPEAPPAMEKRVKELSSVRFTEDLAILKRQALEGHSVDMLKEGDKAYSEGEYDQALIRYKSAYANLGRRPETRKARDKAKIGIAKSYYAKAMLLYKQQDLALAEENAKNARDYGHPKADDLIILIKAGIPVAPPQDVSLQKKTYVNQLDYKNAKKETEYRFWLGKQYYQAGEYDKAQEMFEAVLKRDPQHTEAIRMHRKIDMVLFDKATEELESTREGMMATLRQTWNPRHYTDIDKGQQVINIGKPKATEFDKRRIQIEEKMRGIKIPEIDFRQANINDVIEFLANASQSFDTSPVELGEKRGVNIILKLGTLGDGGQGGAASVPVVDDPFAAVSSGPAATGGGAPSDIPLVTFTARDLSLIEALKVVTDYCGLKYRIDENVVMVVRQNEPDSKIMHRWYPVMNFTDIMAAMGDELGNNNAGGGAGGARGDFVSIDGGGVGNPSAAAAGGDWKEFFRSMGIPWPEGSAIRYMPSLGKLMVANTADNLALFEKILEQFDFVPKQIEIEARFVEVNQEDLDSLGLELGMTDDWDVLRRKGDAYLPLASRPSIRMKANTADGSGGFTTGNRFLTDGIGTGLPIADNIMQIAGVLTNPELNLVLHAMQQKGNSDLLSAPKVTAQSGSEASIKVVEEYIYPTEFTVSGITGGTTAGGGTGGMVGAVVEPGGFETREVGVLLSVLPEVSTEGQMINLTLSPEVCEFVRWEEYGSTFSDANGNPQQLRMPQPIFHTRNIQTQIMIFNGATVVMGGMITEKRTSIDDKIPLLGDIPLIGRLFKSKYDRSVKRNLLIFVTAKMVRPDGKIVKNVEDIQTSPSSTPSE